MGKYKLTAEERETIILFDDSSPKCEVYTCSKPIIKKLDKLCEKHPDSWQLDWKDEDSKTYLTQKCLISFRSYKTKRELSEKQKKNLANRFK